MRLDLKTNTFTFYYDSHKDNIEKIFAKSHGHLNKTQRYSIIERVCLHFEDVFELYKENLPFLYQMLKEIKEDGNCDLYKKEYEDSKEINLDVIRLGIALQKIINLRTIEYINLFRLDMNKFGTLDPGPQTYNMGLEIIAITKHHINTVLKKMPKEKLFQEQCKQSGIKIQYEKSTDSYNLIGKLCPDAKLKKIVNSQDTTDEEFYKPTIINIPSASFSSIKQSKRRRSKSCPSLIACKKRAFRDKILRPNSSKKLSKYKLSIQLWLMDKNKVESLLE